MIAILKMSINREIITVEKCGVIHKFVKCPENSNWLDPWLQNTFANWEKDTFQDFSKCLSTLDINERVALDIGGWIGTTCIWLAHHFAKVHVVEADPVSVSQLRSNIEASGCADKVVVWPRPATLKEENLWFGPHATDAFGGKGLNTSMSQVKSTSNSNFDILIRSVSLDALIEACGTGLLLIKMDIEGGEENMVEPLLRIARERQLCVHLSFHVDWWQNKDLSRFKDVFGDEYDILVTKITANPFASYFFDYRR